MRKTIVTIVIFAVVALAMAWVRVLVGARSEADAGKEALARGDSAAAVHHFDRAIHWYSPGSGAVAESISGLRQAADEYEKTGDPEGALYAWRILRSALYSVRHVSQPYPEVIEAANRRIADVTAKTAVAQKGGDLEAEQKRRYEQLSRPVGPKTGFALLAEAGFLGWVASGFLFIWFGVRPDKGFNGKKALLFSALFVLFYAVWILGLAKA